MQENGIDAQFGHAENALLSLEHAIAENHLTFRVARQSDGNRARFLDGIGIPRNERVEHVVLHHDVAIPEFREVNVG